MPEFLEIARKAAIEAGQVIQGFDGCKHVGGEKKLIGGKSGLRAFLVIA